MKDLTLRPMSSTLHLNSKQTQTQTQMNSWTKKYDSD